MLTTFFASTTTGVSPALPVVTDQDSLDLSKALAAPRCDGVNGSKIVCPRARSRCQVKDGNGLLRKGSLRRIDRSALTFCPPGIPVLFPRFSGGFCHRPWGRHVAARLPRGQSTGIRASVPWFARISCSVDSRITEHRRASRTPLGPAGLRA